MNSVFFLYLNLITFLLAYFGYNYVINKSTFIVYFFVILFISFSIIIFYQNFSKQLSLKTNIYLSGTIWTFYFVIIIICNLIEYISFGFPFISILGYGKKIIYAQYGFPLIHHISVSSWIGLFIKTKNQTLNSFFCLFAIINPLLIINRDLLLLTFFCLFIIILLKNRNSLIPIILMIFVAIIFGVLGNFRSGSALENTNLPILNDEIKSNSLLLWLFTYITSSWYNFFNNIISKSDILIYKNINTFPGVYYWFKNLDTMGIILFYYCNFLVLFFIDKLKNQIKEYQVLYLYILYQSFMTIFSNKIFKTNTLYTAMIFIFIMLLQHNKKYFKYH